MQYSGSFKTIDTPASSSYYSCFAECFAEYLSTWFAPPLLLYWHQPCSWSAECSGKTNRTHLPECHLNNCFSADNTTSNFISSCIKSISKLSKDFLDLYIWLMWSQSFTFQRDWCDHLPQNHLYSFHLSVWWIISMMSTFCLNILPPSFVDSAFHWCFTFVCFLPVILERFKKKDAKRIALYISATLEN